MTTPQRSMEVTYECTLDDYRESFYAQMKPPMLSWFLAGGGILILGISTFSVYEHGFSDAAILPTIAGLFLILPFALRTVQKVWIKKDFLRHPGFAGRAHTYVDDDGIRTEGEWERRETKWPAFTKYQETKNLFILYEGARLLRVFPKRAFGNRELEDFRRLLSSKVACCQSN